SPISKDKIVVHFVYLNEVVIDRTGFLPANQKEVFEIFDRYIKRLKGAKKPAYVSEITKFQLLRNCLIDLHAFNEEKRPVTIDDDLTFILSKWVSDDTALKEVILEPNFAIKDPMRPLAGKLPAQKVAFHETIVLRRKQKFEPTAKFVFTVYVEDNAGNQAKHDVCPNFFANQLSTNRP
ncbi:hypothetical protein L0152_16335, partial [bacterium]|nr:hypothetical protein [bacterium]